MNWRIVIGETLLVSGAAGVLAVAIAGHRRRPGLGSAHFILMSLALAAWSLGSALEVGSLGLPTKILFAKTQYFGIALAPLMCYLYVLYHTGVALRPRLRSLLAVIPTATILICWTNELHGLLWAQVWLATVDSVPVFAFRPGLWFWVQVVYAYALLAHACVLLLRARRHMRQPLAGQTTLLLVAIAAPWLANVVHQLGLRSVLPINITPLAFTMSSIAFGVSLLRYQMPEVIPAARERSFESMDDAAFVLDSDYHIVDLNRAAADVLGLPQAAIVGQAAERALSAHPALLRRAVGDPTATVDASLSDGNGGQRRDVRVSDLVDRRGHSAGRLVILRDTADADRAELARGVIYSVSEAVHTADDLPQLYRQIHAAVSRLLPADNCYIAAYDAAADRVSFAYVVDERAQPLLPRVHGRGLAEHVLRRAAPLLARQEHLAALLADGSIAHPDCDPLPYSYLGVPLNNGHQPIGVLAVLSYGPETVYTSEDLETLRFVSDQIAMAILRKQGEHELKAVREQLEERVEQRTAELADLNAQLSAREERYRLLFNGTSDGVLVHEISIHGYSGRIVEVNEAACQLLGYSREALLAMSVKDTLVPEHRGGVEAKCRLLLAQKHSMFEREHLAKSGARISAEVNAQLFVLDGKPVVLSVIRDITQRKQLQGQLLYRMELERLVAAVSAKVASLGSDRLDDAIDLALHDVGNLGQADRSYVFQFSADGSTMTNTHEWCADGIEPQMGVLQSLPCANLPWWTERILSLQDIQVPDVAAMPDEASVERELLQAQDVRSLVVVPLAYGDQAIGFLGFDSVRQQKTWAEEDVRLLRTMADIITAAIERRRADQALRASEERYRVLFNSLADPVFVYAHDPDSGALRLATVNDSASQVTGHSREDLLDLPPARLYASGGGALLHEPFGRGKRYLFEDALVTASGDSVPVQVTVSMFDLGTRPMVLAVARNVSEHRRLEQQLLQAQKMESVGRLAGGVAHDFNNLLTVISGHASFTLEALPEGHPSIDDLQDLMLAVQRARDLTAQLLAFSRRQVIEPRLLDLGALVTGLRKMLARLIGEDIELVAQVDHAPVRAQGDHGQIEQVIVNLVVNARDSMPRGGTLTVGAVRVNVSPADVHRHGVPAAGDYATLTVKDTGTGMTDDVKAHLFEPFFTTKEVGKGTGLGLATVYGIVQQHSGHIRVDSEPGRGSTFTIYLPLAAGRAAPGRGPRREHTSTEGGQETVLLVEDDASVRRVTERMLRTLGYNVLVAVDGPSALSLADGYTGPIDALLTDVVMPRMGGPELAQAMRSRRPGIGVLFVSGYTAGVVDEHGIRDGHVDLLQKPFSQESLAMRLRQVIDRET